MTQEIDERKFWNWVFSNGLVPGQVFDELGAESLAECNLDKAEVMAKLTDLAKAQQAELPAGWGLVKNEGYALAIAWADVYTPEGVKVNLTARHGATVQDIMATALAWQQAAGGLRALGWKVGSNRCPSPKSTEPAERTEPSAKPPAQPSAKPPAKPPAQPPTKPEGEVYLVIEHLQKSVVNGKVSYRVFGPPRFRRYGVRVWPEVAEVLVQFGVDLEAMEPGAKKDAASLGLKGKVFFTGEGKASKITAILPI